MIFNFSTFPTQIAFRGINKGWCQFVGKRYFKHALVWDNKFAPGITFEGYERKPPFRGSDSGSLSDRYSQLLLESVEVIDIGCDFPGQAGRFNWIILRCPNLRTIRRIGWQAARIETTLLPQWHQNPKPYRVVDYYYRQPAPSIFEVRLAIDQPRHTIHFKWDEDQDARPWFEFITELGPTCALREIVVVLWPTPPTSSRSDVEEDARNRLCEYGLSLVGSFASGLEKFLFGGGRLKFVGLEQLVEDTQFESVDDVFELVKAAYFGFPHPSVLTENIDFVTLDTWWTDLGPRKAEEGMWNPLDRPTTVSFSNAP